MFTVRVYLKSFILSVAFLQVIFLGSQFSFAQLGFSCSKLFSVQPRVQKGEEPPEIQTTIISTLVNIAADPSRESAPIENRSAEGLITEISFRPEELRSNSELSLIKKYKNDPLFANWLEELPRDQFTTPGTILSQYESMSLQDRSSITPMRPKIVDLDQQQVGREALRLSPDEAWGEFEFSAPISKTPLEKYDRLLLSLRKGDTLIVGGSTMVVDYFLGSGNATHVFGLEGNPDVVLRLPFIVDYLRWKNFSSRDRARNEARKYVQKEPNINGVTKVKIVAHGPLFGYVITTRVKGFKTGRAFIAHLIEAKKDKKVISEEDLELFYSLLDQVKLIYSGVFLGSKLDQFLDWYESNRSTNPHDNPRLYGFFHEFRQFIFSENQGIWVWVDWDPLVDSM